MAYQATVIPVMIASPGDVSVERGVVRGVLHDWNDVNGSTSRVLLVPVGWDSHASPELGMKPQELINSRILKGCDLLIAVFWTRLGTPTDAAPSGTAEEILEHVTAGKPAMVYFSSRPVAPESINLEQYQKLKEFRKECEARGLIETYENEQDLQRKLSKQIQLTLRQNGYLQKLLENETSELRIESQDSNPRVMEVGLGNDAKELLKAAATDAGGTILSVRHLGGHHIQAGGQQFGGSYGRESAKWQAALDELVEQELVVDRGYKGEVFELTNLGWRVADEL